MPAHVREGLDLAFRAPHDDCGFVGELEHEEVARARDLGYVPRHDPVTGDDPFELQAINVRIGVEALLERHARHVIGDELADGARVLHMRLNSICYVIETNIPHAAPDGLRATII